MAASIDGEIAHLRAVRPAAVITGSYLTVPVTCRVLEPPLGVLISGISSTCLANIVMVFIQLTGRHPHKPARRPALACLAELE